MSRIQAVGKPWALGIDVHDCQTSREVMEKAKPFGVEADTSIERLQRRKDFNKMADFIKNAHSLR